MIKFGFEFNICEVKITTTPTATVPISLFEFNICEVKSFAPPARSKCPNGMNLINICEVKIDTKGICG